MAKGNFTNITHVVGESAARHEIGDQVFDVGTVLYNVSKGWPGKILEVNRDTYTRVFGIPARGVEEAYQASTALYNHQNTVGHYVRVAASDARYAVLKAKAPVAAWDEATTYPADELAYLDGQVYKSAVSDNTGNNPASDDGTNWEEYDNDQGGWAINNQYIVGDVVVDNGLSWICVTNNNSATAPSPSAGDGTNWDKYIQSESLAFTATPEDEDGYLFKAWVKNGATKDNQYGIAVTAVDATAKTFDIGVFETVNGEAGFIEGSPFTVGLTPGALTAGKKPLFIEAVFEQSSQAVGIKLNPDADFSQVFAQGEDGISWLNGGDPGGIPTKDDYDAAWALFEGAEVELDALFMAGDVEVDHISAALKACAVKNVRLEAEPVGGTPSAAEQWAGGTWGVYDYRLSFNYGRVSFNDPFYPGSRVNTGTSGFAIAAKAWCREKDKGLVHPSVEQTPAGEDYGLLRGVTGIRNESNLSGPDMKLLSQGWINYLVNAEKGIMFWEQYTYFGEESERAYKRSVDLMNYAYKIHAQIMKKHQFRSLSDDRIIDKLSPLFTYWYSKGVLVDGDNEIDDYDNRPFQFRIERDGRVRRISRMMRTSKAIGPVILETIITD